ncbi:hypothetical protein KY311_01705 [Candidatus Woesearchaeota archaeon]|nr:hypothetical protein [Candidatus Woesearchaeota archaeon]
MKYAMKPGKSYGGNAPKQYAGMPMATYSSTLTVNYGNGQSMTYTQRLSFPLNAGYGFNAGIGLMPYGTQVKSPSAAYGRSIDSKVNGYDKATDAYASRLQKQKAYDAFQKTVDRQKGKDAYAQKKDDKKYLMSCALCGKPSDNGTSICSDCANTMKN